MSEPSSSSARPVSLVTTLFVLALFAVFLLVVSRYYNPTAAAPQNQVAENFRTDPKDPKYDPTLAWKATPATRRAALAALREKQAKQAAAYAWVDQPAGIVQLPIARAMELTVQQYGPKP